MPLVSHTLLRARREEIVREWEALVAAGPRDVKLTGAALRDDLPALLDELAAWLERGDQAEGVKLESIACRHALARIDWSYPLAQVVRELRLLRTAVLHRLREPEPQGGAAASAPEQLVELEHLNEALDVAVADVIEQFVGERERRLDESHRRAQALERSVAARDAFRVRLGDALRPLADAAEIQATTSRVLGEHLGAGRVVYVEFEGEHVTIPEGYRAGLPSIAGRYHLLAGGRVIPALEAGRTVAVADVAAPPVTPAERDEWLSVSTRAFLTVPLVKAGQLTALLSVHHSTPRVWSGEEVTLVEEVAERTWAAVERARAEAALRQTEEALRLAARHKDEFLAVLSHELRNPLAPIRNAIYLLEHAAPGTERAARARDVLRRQTAHLTRIVDDLLDLTRISRGKIDLRRTRLDLQDVVRRTTDDLRSLFEQGGLALRVELAPAPLWVDADATRVAQVLGNLLQNAVKFTPAGGHVTVTSAERGGAAVVTVRDDGLGMDPDDVQRMFEPFAQAEATLARTRGGLGLGLSLVKGLVELHGGVVTARSEGLGRGAELAVSLPLAAAPGALAEAPGQGHGPAIGGRLVLVVEDNLDAAETLADILELQGLRVRVAHDGRSGLELARELRPDVVLCDLGLPDLDGFEVARRLRADPALRSCRLIALSGYAQPEDVRRAGEAGFDAHLAKPPALEELLALLAPEPDRAR